MTRHWTVAAIAAAIDGEVIGDGALPVARLAHPADVTAASDLALATDARLLPLLKDGKGRAAVVASPVDSAGDFLAARIVVPRPRVALARLTALFAVPVALPAGIHPSAVVEPGARLGQGVTVGAFVYIGADAVIGDRVVIHPHVSIGPGAILGDDSLIHAGARIGAGVQIGARAIIHFNACIGADGFSFVTPQAGSVEAAKSSGGSMVAAANTHLIRIASLGSVRIGADVEIGAGACIDRGTIASTTIGSGTKIDNQVQIGHNVIIGANCLICGRVGIAGSARLGDRVVLGGATGVADHVEIGDDAIAMGMSGIAGNVPARTVVGGTPAQPRDKAMEMVMNIGRLTSFFARVRDLAARLDKVEKGVQKD